MAALASFLPYVLPYVPGCPAPLAEQHIRDICIAFCATTLIAQQALDPVSIIAGIADYDLDPPTASRVHLIMRAWFDGDELRSLGPDSAVRPAMFNQHAEPPPPGRPTGFYRIDPAIRLNATPEANAPFGLTTLAAIKPTRTAETVPDILFDDYAFEIGQGAAATLMTVPNQPFTDFAAASSRAALYASAIGPARIRAAKAHGRTTATVRPRPFA